MKYKSLFCSKKCSLKKLSEKFNGKNHPNWTTGEYSYKNFLIRHKNPKCVLCGIKDKNVLAVHHIDKNRQNNKVYNLSWLCHNCHFLIHHYPKVEEKFNRIFKK